MTSGSSFEEVSTEMVNAAESKLDDLSNDEEEQVDTTEDEAFLQVNVEEKDTAYQKIDVRATRHLDVNTNTNTIAPVTGPTRDLPIRLRETRRAYTGEAPPKRLRDDDQEGLTEQGVKPRVLGLPTSSWELEQQHQRVLAGGEHTIFGGPSHVLIDQMCLQTFHKIIPEAPSEARSLYHTIGSGQ